MKYQVVEAGGLKIEDAVKRLEREVKELCSEGWEPQGGISIAVTDYQWYIVCQAMIKK